MLVVRPQDAPLDAKPIPYHHDIAERDAGLRHAEVTGVHANDEHLALGAPESTQVGAVGRPGVNERVVDMTYGASTPNRCQLVAQPLRDGDQRCGGHLMDILPRRLSNREV